jgi:hypothetical protein
VFKLSQTTTSGPPSCWRGVQQADVAGLGEPLAPIAAAVGVEARIRQGIQFIQHDQVNGELRITGDDDAALLLWGAQWLDEHRDYIITAMRFEHPVQPGGEGELTATVVVELTTPGQPHPTT